MNLKTYLEENNIPTSEFAKRLGITKAMVHRYITVGEDGKRTIPKFDLMMKILKETDYQVSIGSFYLEARLAIRQHNKEERNKRRKDAKPTRN
jgi:transcriptional regulator with XRE-family HTH domain